MLGTYCSHGSSFCCYTLNCGDWSLLELGTRELFSDQYHYLCCGSHKPQLLRSAQSVKWKFEYLHQYISLDKTQNIVEMDIIILKNDTRIGMSLLLKSWGS